jgi:hypothetical protein
MRRPALVLATVAALAFVPAAAAAPFRATLNAPTHTPKTNAKWTYTVRATSPAGRPIPAAITVQILDPFGGAHAVTYANTKKPIVRRPFDGVFRDFIQFPSDSKGFQVTVRFTVYAKGAKLVLRYWIKAR